MKALNKFFCSIILLIVFSACNPTPAQAPITNIPAINSDEITTEKTANCNADNVLKNLKETIPYDEFTVLHSEIDGKKSLVIWLVDPEIPTNITSLDISSNVKMVIRYAIKASYKVLTLDQCVSTLFDYINPVIVDKNYNGWFSGQISPKSLTRPEPTNEEQIDKLGSNFDIGYIRQNALATITASPSDSCTWQEVNQKLKLHFSQERQNVGFYFVLDDVGTNVWAHWNTKEEYLKSDLLASMLNITMEIQCLHPQPDNLIFTIVNDSGEILIMGILPKEGIQAYPNIFDSIKIFYTRK